MCCCEVASFSARIDSTGDWDKKKKESRRYPCTSFLAVFFARPFFLLHLAITLPSLWRGSRTRPPSSNPLRSGAGQREQTIPSSRLPLHNTIARHRDQPPPPSPSLLHATISEGPSYIGMPRVTGLDLLRVLPQPSGDATFFQTQFLTSVTLATHGNNISLPGTRHQSVCYSPTQFVVAQVEPFQPLGVGHFGQDLADAVAFGIEFL